MKKLLFGATLALAIGGMAFASTPELMITSGASTVTIIGAGNAVDYSNTDFANWDIQVESGVSSSPAGVFGIDLTSLDAECDGGATCAALTVELTDINFAFPGGTTAGTFTSSYSGSDHGSTASTSQLAWVDPGDAYFGTTLALPALGPFTGTGVFAASSSAGLASGDLFSMTLEDTFAGCTGGAPPVTPCSLYSTDGGLSGVPEPASVALFGTVLVFCASRLRRRKAA